MEELATPDTPAPVARLDPATPQDKIIPAHDESTTVDSEQQYTADEDLNLFLDALNGPTERELDAAERDQQIAEQLDEAEKDLNATRSVKVSVKRDVARAMDLSIQEFDRHFVSHATETGQRFGRVWTTYEEGYLATLDKAKEIGTRGQTMQTIRTYLETKGTNYFTCRVDEHTDKSKWDPLTWEAFLMWRLMAILYDDKAGLLKLHGFSENVAFQLCWLLRGNRVYARNAARKAKMRRAATGKGASKSVPSTPAAQERKAKARFTADARAAFGSAPRPVAEAAKKPAGVAKEKASSPRQKGARVKDKAVRQRTLTSLAETVEQAAVDEPGESSEDSESDDEPPALDEEEMLVGEDAAPSVQMATLERACKLPADAPLAQRRDCPCRFHAFQRIKRLCVGQMGPDGVMSAASGGEVDDEAVDDMIVGGDTNAGPAQDDEQPLLALSRSSAETKETAKMQKWLDEMMSTDTVASADLAAAVAGLSIDARTFRMRGSSVKLKWWQVTTVWDFVQRVRRGGGGGAVLGDKVGLGKTYEALAVLLQVRGPDVAKLYADGL